MSQQLPEILNLAQAGAYLQRSRSWVYQQIHTDPTFPVVRVGCGYRVRLASLRAWVRAQERGGVETRLLAVATDQAGSAGHCEAESMLLDGIR